MPKLAIYVPKQAKKQIEKWRKTINFSQVFMRALEGEIRERQRSLEVGDDQLTAAARHYRRQLTANADALVDLGHQLGTRLVLDCQLEPDTIHRLVGLAARAELSPEDRGVVEEVLGKQARKLAEEAGGLGYHEQSHPGFQADLYRGVVLGVTAAWERVCAEMNQL